jgi:hypothetical protein
MPTWLWRSVVSVCFAISVLSVGQWASCRFYVLPSLWPMYLNGQPAKDGKSIEPPSLGCADVDSRTVAVMMGVLTTLISLSRNAE